MDGLFTIKKLPKINSLASYSNDTDVYGIKRARKSIIIERLHLPPEGSTLAPSSSSSSLRSIPLCSSTSKNNDGSKLLDF